MTVLRLMIQHIVLAMVMTNLYCGAHQDNVEATRNNQVFRNDHEPGKNIIDWLLQPLLPGETGMASGMFGSDNTVSIRDIRSEKIFTVDAFDESSTALKFTLPNSSVLPPGAYDIAIGNSEPKSVNLPQIWWWQGDQGQASTPGGWVRVFGLSIGAATSDSSCAHIKGSESTLRMKILQSVSKGQYEQATLDLEQLKVISKCRARVLGPPVLSLSLPTETEDAHINISATNYSEWDALFYIPGDIPAGSYSASISNGLETIGAPGGWIQLEMFLSPDEPVYTSVEIIPAPTWKSDIFSVDCDLKLPIFSRPCGWVGNRSTAQLNAALEQASQNGGGIVYLPRGQYYIDGPIVVPNGTIIRGEGEQLVSIYFREDNPGSAPKPGYIYGGNSATVWGVQDVTIYVTHFYYNVVYVANTCTNFGLERVRIRAAAWAFLGDPGTPNDPAQSGRGNRVAKFSRGQIGDVVYLGGNTNYRIVDCDLLGTAIIIHTGGHGTVGSGGGSARFGYIARNTIWNANAAHWFDGIKEVIFEYNTIRPAGTELAWGNNIDNYEQGYAQHVFHANNWFQCEWAGDREFMTFDPVDGSYNGHAAVDPKNATLITLKGGSGSVGSSVLGGMVSILDGTGAGQYRRVASIISSSKLLLDKPFSIYPDSTSIIQIGPFKGSMIFHKNRYEDGGAFQFYANAADVVVAQHRFARVEALLSWGRASGSTAYCPNIHVQFLDNVIEEGNHLWNWNATYPYPHPKTIEPYWIGVMASDQDIQPCEPYPHGSCDPSKPNPSKPLPFQGPINHLVAIKRNTILSNGGINVRGHSTNILIESNRIVNSSVGVDVTNTSHVSYVHVANNTHEGWV